MPLRCGGRLIPRGGVECSAIDDDLAVGDRSKSGNGVEQSRLARTGRPKDSGDPGIERRVDVELEICQRYTAAQFHLRPFPERSSHSEAPDKQEC